MKCETNMGVCSVGKLLGRICLSAIFLFAGIGKLVNYEGTLQYMASAGITMTPFFLIAAAAVEILGGLSLLLGYKIRFGALMLLLFLIPTTLIFHNFWTLQGADRQAQLVEFLKNLAIFGGLLFVGSTGAGCFSLDACCTSSCTLDPDHKDLGQKK
jgi:putative oxidoreductase